MNRFENKVAVITGAAGGIGEATTRRIVSEGGKVVIADYSKERADKLAAELTLSGADVRSVYFSATELQSCKELIAFAIKEYGQIDILINNVGGTDPKRDTSIEKLDIDYFDEAFHLNLSCTMYLSQLVIPVMKTHGGGNIVNVASISGYSRFKRYALRCQQSRSYQSYQIYCNPDRQEKYPLQCCSPGIGSHTYRFKQFE
jgi:NAD(P)-dependent dehydrogenase (short-subunit alcohol dehydrogenase family)